MSLLPYGRRVLFAESPRETRRASGLVLPASAADDTAGIGVVVEVGDDVPHLEPGAVIYYRKGTSTRLGDCYVIDADHIIAWERP